MRARSLALIDHAPAGAGEDWVSLLPALIASLCEDWHLSRDDERIAGGAWGVVVYCRTENGREAALKVCANEQRLSAETSAMLAGPAAPQLACSLTARVRCCCNGPARHTIATCASRLAMLLDALHRPAKASGLGLGDWRASINAAVRQVPSLQTIGRDLLREGDGRPLHTLHGDLQPANILEHRGASAVIDPMGIAGPRELDVANAALYNNWGEEASARIRRLAELTGTDPAFALRFGQLSAIYAALARRP